MATVRLNFAEAKVQDICVRGISVQLAAKIIQRRDERPGDFLDEKSLDKLRDIPGLGNTKIKRLKQLVYVGDAPPPVIVPDPEDIVWRPEQCTYNGKEIMQTWFICRTCAPTAVDCGCCRSCAQVCHAGHHLQPVPSSMFSCDCGGGLMGMPCTLQQTTTALDNNTSTPFALPDTHLRNRPTVEAAPCHFGDPRALLTPLHIDEATLADCSQQAMMLLQSAVDEKLRRDVGIAQALLERVAHLEATLTEERRSSEQLVRQAETLDKNRQAQISDLMRDLQASRTTETALRVAVNDARVAEQTVDRIQQELAEMDCTCKAGQRLSDGRAQKRRREDEDETSEGELPRATHKASGELALHQKVLHIMSMKRGPTYSQDKRDLVVSCKIEGGGEDVVEIPSKELAKSLMNAQLLLNFYEDHLRLSIGKRKETT